MRCQAFHYALLDTKGNLEQADVLKIAKKVGLNIKRLKRDMNDPKVEKVIESNMKLAQKIGVMGTPAFIVANNTDDATKFISQFAPGAIQKSNLQSMISKARGNDTPAS